MSSGCKQKWKTAGFNSVVKKTGHVRELELNLELAITLQERQRNW
jgi:hypothetical protein